ncbi:hypothetical protein WJX74_010045 [Apatococcus lobatus]|uniref:Uncharacterized protein n=1 Tax=Apatococcus lobatus TaxID=904363 RepID=A0AAW1R0T7_9CHLO
MQPVIVNGKTIRIDAETGAGALVDMVKALTGETSTIATRHLTKMLKKETRLSNQSKKAIINNKSSAIWTAEAHVLVEIGWCCTGRGGAKMVAHALEGDASLVDEIEHRRHQGLENHYEVAPTAHRRGTKDGIANMHGLQPSELVSQQKYVQLLEREVSLKRALVELDKERRMLCEEVQHIESRPRKKLCHPDSYTGGSFTIPELLMELGRGAADTQAFMRKARGKVYLQVYRNFQADLVPGSREPCHYIREAKETVGCAITKLMGPSLRCTQQRQGGLEKYLHRVDDAAAGALAAQK